MGVELGLGLGHQLAQGRGVAGPKHGGGALDEGAVDVAEKALDGAAGLVLREGIGPVQVAENADGVLAALEIPDQNADRAAEAQLLGSQEVAVEGHLHGHLAEGAALVHAAAPGGGEDLALVGGLHLGPHGHLEAIHAVEGAGDEDAEGGGGTQPLLHRQVGEVVVDLDAADMVEGEQVVGHAGRVAEKLALLGNGQQFLGVHGDDGLLDPAVVEPGAHAEFAV